MIQSNYRIQIPEPCHEDWNGMKPDATGKFCSSCSKSVIDFTNKTDEEIKTILLQNQHRKLCGHFKSSQVDRPLIQRLNPQDLPVNMSITKKFTIALFLVFGTFLFSCTDPHGKKIDDVNEMIGMIEAPDSLLKIAPGEPEEVVDSVLTLGEWSNSKTGELMLAEGSLIESEAPLADTNICQKEMIKGDMKYVPEEPQEVVINVMGGMAVTMVTSLIDYPDSLNSKTQAPLEEVLNENPLLFRIYPNPSEENFNISYTLLHASDVSLHVFDINGSLVKTVVTLKSQHEGKYILPIELNGLPNGIYIANLICEGKRYTEKLILAK